MDRPKSAADRIYSFVATSRNDDHGGDVLRRTQSFIDKLAMQCKRHRLKGELILVEWNPPGSRASLADVLNWPAGEEWFEAKVVTAPHAVHLEFANARSLALFQMIGKNVGIRRAKGDFVVATNIDIIFSDELFIWMKQADEHGRYFFRADRWDIPNELQDEPDFDLLLARAQTEAIRKNMGEGTIERLDGLWPTPELRRIDHILLNPLKNKLRRLKTEIGQGRVAEEAIDELIDTTLPNMRQFYLASNLHLNGCGDFTMMTASHWRQLRGYPEWPVFSWNIDSVFLAQAVLSGFSELVAPPNAAHYHIEHGYASGYTPQGSDALWRRMSQRSVPVIGWEQYQTLIGEMWSQAATVQPLTFNDENWGLSEHDLPVFEHALGAEARQAVASNMKTLHEPFDTTGLKSEVVSLLAAEVGPAAEMRMAWANGAPYFRIKDTAASGAEIVRLRASHLFLPSQPYWVRCRLRLLDGRVCIGLAGGENGQLLANMDSLLVEDGWREVVLCAPAGTEPVLVVRSQASLCVIEMTDVEFLWERPCTLDGAAVTPLDDRTDVEKRPLPFAASVGFAGRGGILPDGRLEVTPFPEPWGYGAVIDIPDSVRETSPDWIVLDFDRVHGSYGIGITDQAGEFLARTKAPDRDAPAQIWLPVSKGDRLSAIVISNWSEVSAEPAVLRDIWQVWRSRDGHAQATGSPHKVAAF